MKFLSELLERAAPAPKTKKSAKKGKPHDGIHDDGTELEFNKDGPFIGKKFSQFVGSNMFMNMVSSGDMAGTMEADQSDAVPLTEGRKTAKSPEDKANNKLLNVTLMAKKAATHRDKKSDYRRNEGKLNLAKTFKEGIPQKSFTYQAYTELQDSEGKKLDCKIHKGNVVAANRDDAREKVLNAHRKAYKVDIKQSGSLTEDKKGRLVNIMQEGDYPVKSLADWKSMMSAAHRGSNVTFVASKKSVKAICDLKPVGTWWSETYYSK